MNKSMTKGTSHASRMARREAAAPLEEPTPLTKAEHEAARRQQEADDRAALKRSREEYDAYWAGVRASEIAKSSNTMPLPIIAVINPSTTNAS